MKILAKLYSNIKQKNFKKFVKKVLTNLTYSDIILPQQTERRLIRMLKNELKLIDELACEKISWKSFVKAIELYVLTIK